MPRMCRPSIAAAVLLAFFGCWMQSQASAQPAPATRPSTSPAGAGQIKSPDVGADGRITFRISAPKASEVLVSTEWDYKRTPLVKAENGVWSVTLGPVGPNVYSYQFIIDSVPTLDPRNAEIKQGAPAQSLVEVGGTASPFALRDVPHGVVEVVRYHSKSLDAERRMHVYLPPGYDQDPSRMFPVLFLLHGSGDNDAHWTNLGRANLILDNLIAERKAEPMIIVMPHGHTPGRAGPGNNAAFADDLLKDIVPYVETRYRTKPGPENHAIAGLSMGGGQSVSVGLRNSGMFGFVISFSGSVPNTPQAVADLVPDPKALNDHLRLLWVGCGRGDFLLKRNQDFIAALDQAGVKHTWHESEGMHHWPLWRTYLVEVAPLLFREQGK
jgi:enterochelin esterase-like enzyme